MAMIKCKECGKDIADSAEYCPFCGCSIWRQNANKRIIKLFLVVFCIILLFIFISIKAFL